jgi:predicted ribosome quality control (RQC) complex YloA/Tae2 family protein
MSFDALATAAMVDELQGLLLGGRVQKVLLPDEMSVGFEIYVHRERRYLYASADTREARIQLTAEKLRRGVDTPSPLLLLLRKYVRGARLLDIEQPAFERIVRLTFEGKEGRTALYTEIMGRHSNIILVDAEGMVMDALKRIPPELSRRVVLPKHPYGPPPPQDKVSYASLTPGKLGARLQERTGPLWRGLVSEVLGLSPQLAREVVYRVTGDTQAVEADLGGVLDEIDALMSRARESDWAPCVALEGTEVVAFAPYLLQQFPEQEPTETLSEAITRYHESQRAAAMDDYVAVREQLQQAIKEGRGHLRSRRRSLRRALEQAEGAEALMHKGQLILAYSAQIEPEQKELVASWQPGEEPLHIELDPDLTPAENAQAYFDDYEKRQRAQERVPKLLRQVRVDIAYLAQLEADLMLAEDRSEIDQVRDALVEAGHLKKKKKESVGKPTGPKRYRSADDYEILVGKNSRQNEVVTFDRARSNDIWLHARQTAGSHVIILTQGQDIPQSTLQQAAQLAAFHSKARLDTGVDVDYTEQRNVRRIPGAGLGMVTYRRFKTIRVTPRDWPEQRID